MNEQDRHNLFTDLITSHQSELYGYIFAVVRNREDADDLFQSVCMVLWRKFGLFQPDSSFFSWARQTARFEISNFLRRKSSSNYVSGKLLDTLTTIAIEAQDNGAEQYLAALRRCRQNLNATDAELLQLRYIEELSIREIAGRLQRLQPNVCRSLNRIRRLLLECIQMELAHPECSGGEHS
jgi:RNA polymerase sigma-70 factor, ECF subfamily